MPWLLIGIGGVILITAIILVVIGLRQPRGDEATLQQRLEEFSARGESINLEEIELSQPFAERIIYPLAHKLGQLAVKFTPENAVRTTQKKLELAGNPGGLDPTV